MTRKLMTTVEGLDPIIDYNAKVLILGSMPSVESVRKGEYYANQRNQFWKILFSVFGSELAPSYPAKVSFLKGRRIALWDVIKQCDREGSSDSKITNMRINDFTSMLVTYPKIKCLCFNGQKAYKIFQQQIGLETHQNLTTKMLPSTNPANAGIPIEVKTVEWTLIKTLLLD